MIAQSIVARAFYAEYLNKDVQSFLQDKTKTITSSRKPELIYYSENVVCSVLGSSS